MGSLFWTTIGTIWDNLGFLFCFLRGSLPDKPPKVTEVRNGTQEVKVRSGPTFKPGFAQKSHQGLQVDPWTLKQITKDCRWTLTKITKVCRWAHQKFTKVSLRHLHGLRLASPALGASAWGPHALLHLGQARGAPAAAPHQCRLKTKRPSDRFSQS